MSINIDTEQVINRVTNGLLDKREVAARLRISPRTLDSWLRKKRIPFFKIGTTVRFRMSDVLERLQASYRVN